MTEGRPPRPSSVLGYLGPAPLSQRSDLPFWGFPPGRLGGERRGESRLGATAGRLTAEPAPPPGSATLTLESKVLTRATTPPPSLSLSRRGDCFLSASLPAGESSPPLDSPTSRGFSWGGGEVGRGSGGGGVAREGEVAPARWGLGG